MPRHPRDPNAHLGDEDAIESSQVVPLLYLCLAVAVGICVVWVFIAYLHLQVNGGFPSVLSG
jgi:hypothetical protein